MHLRKYRNTKTTFNDIKFDSKAEADYYRYLKNQEKKGEVSEIKLQPKFTLQKNFKFNGKIIRSITYTSDFKFKDKNGFTHIVDVKGFKTNEFKIKEKMLKFKFKDEEKILIYCVKLARETWVEC